MQMVYNSDSFVVVQIDVANDAAVADGSAAAGEPAPRGGFEIVDKFARKGIFIEGAVAAQFKSGVQALMASGPNEEALDDFIATYTTLAQQPLVLH